jgi:hypothetical protein
VFNKDGKEVEDESASKEPMSAVRGSKREANKLVRPGCLSLNKAERGWCECNGMISVMSD